MLALLARPLYALGLVLIMPLVLGAFELGGRTTSQPGRRYCISLPPVPLKR